MFYTKYRPQKFSEISRPNEAADSLSKQITSGKISHAYLFVGPRGTGKTSTARILAKALNCEHISKNGDPCDECAVCEAVRKGSYLDLVEIDAASNRGIDDIRELKSKVKLAPTAGKNKIYIIDEVHMLTTEAFNALLKTLEEPPVNTIFVLCTTEIHKVPETVKSRCQVYKFKRATIKQIVTKLERIVEEEAITIEKEDLEKIARAALGGFRDAENMLQQVADGEVTVESLLNVGSKERFLEFSDSLFDGNSQAALKTVNKIFDEGTDVYVWSGELVKHLRELLMIKSGMPADMIEVTDELITGMKDQAARLPLSWMVSALEIFVEAQSKVRNSFMPQLPLELAVVKLCGIQKGEDPGQIRQDNPPAKPFVFKPKSSPTPKQSSAEKQDAPEVEITEELVLDSVEADSVQVNIEFSSIEKKWVDVIDKIDRINKSIHGLLRAGKPVAIEGRFVTLAVSYSFHKERLEAPKNRDVLEKVLKEIFDADLRIKCVVDEDTPRSLGPREVGVLTDYNITPIDKNAVIDMLDGGLPL